MDTAAILNVLGVVSGNRQNSPGPVASAPAKKRDHSRSKSWDKSRGHKKHCKH
jgi:hypothetical protein